MTLIPKQVETSIIEAGRNINIKAGNQMMIKTAANWEVKVGADGKLTCGGMSSINRYA